MRLSHCRSCAASSTTREAFQLNGCLNSADQRPPGSVMALRDDGQVAGSVSGGCIEDDLIYRLRHGDPAFSRPGLTTYGADAEEGRRFGLPCGGTVQVVRPCSANIRNGFLALGAWMGSGQLRHAGTTIMRSVTGLNSIRCLHHWLYS